MQVLVYGLVLTWKKKREREMMRGLYIQQKQKKDEYLVKCTRWVGHGRYDMAWHDTARQDNGKVWKIAIERMDYRLRYLETTTD
jgi:hypothetical protein